MDEHILARADGTVLFDQRRRQGHWIGPFHGQGICRAVEVQFAIVSCVGVGTTVSLWLPAGESRIVEISLPTQLPTREAVNFAGSVARCR